MGRYSMFKLRHNLDVSSIEALVADLSGKLGCKVGLNCDMYDFQLLNALELHNLPDYRKKYDTADIYIEDCYFEARLLMEHFGDSILDVIGNNPSYEYLLREISDLKRGLTCYLITQNIMYKFGDITLFSIMNNTLSGTPYFNYDNWIPLNCALDVNSQCDIDFITKLNGWRKHLYKYLKPLLYDGFIYYHSSSVDVDEINYMHIYNDLPKRLDEIGFQSFDLKEYLFNTHGSINYNTDKILIRDDFADIKQSIQCS